MPTAKIYHNPRCSKSRATLELLKTQHDDIEIIKYLDNPPSVSDINTLLKQLNLGVRDILRKNETEYKEHMMSDARLSNEQLITMVHQYPKVLERPIVCYNNKAIIGRPPENVLELFK